MLCLVFSVSGASLLATVCVLAKLRTIAKGKAPETPNTKHQSCQIHTRFRAGFL